MPAQLPVLTTGGLPQSPGGATIGVVPLLQQPPTQMMPIMAPPASMTASPPIAMQSAMPPAPLPSTGSVSLGAPSGGTQIRVTQVALSEQGPYRQLKVEDALAYLDKVRSASLSLRVGRLECTTAGGCTFDNACATSRAELPCGALSAHGGGLRMESWCISGLAALLRSAPGLRQRLAA